MHSGVNRLVVVHFDQWKFGSCIQEQCVWAYFIITFVFISIYSTGTKTREITGTLSKQVKAKLFVASFFVVSYSAKLHTNLRTVNSHVTWNPTISEKAACLCPTEKWMGANCTPLWHHTWCIFTLHSSSRCFAPMGGDHFCMNFFKLSNKTKTKPEKGERNELGELSQKHTQTHSHSVSLLAFS